jgi:hypothetical protein
VVLSFLLMVSAAASYRLGGTRQGSARTGALAALGLIGLLMVVVRARTFAALEIPAPMGEGLAVGARSLSWQLEVWSVYLAVACAAFAFAGVVGAQLAETPGTRIDEREAVRLAAGLLTVAVLAAVWRDYETSGSLLGISALSSVGLLTPAWLLAFAHLHAPGGEAVPAWAIRWRRVLGVALFPAVLGAGAALLAGVSAPPQPVLWVGGLAVGILSGAMAGIGWRRRGSEELKEVPGFGPWAVAGGGLALGIAGLIAAWGLFGGTGLTNVASACLLFGVGAAAAWSVARPAGRFKRVWPVAVGVALAAAVAGYAASGWAAPAFALAAGLAAATVVGLFADLFRMSSARQAGGLEARAHRRLASTLGHAGLAFIALGLGAGALTQWETQSLEPGDSLSLGAGANGVRVTYLGLSRYQIGGFDRRVASFTLYRGDSAPRLVTAAINTDLKSQTPSQVPALQRGIVSDIIVGIAGFRSDEAIMCRLAARPLSGLVWLGGILLLASIFTVGRTTW